jgi:hypothetical protein
VLCHFLKTLQGVQRRGTGTIGVSIQLVAKLKY